MNPIEEATNRERRGALVLSTLFALLPWYPRLSDEQAHHRKVFDTRSYSTLREVGNAFNTIKLPPPFNCNEDCSLLILNYSMWLIVPLYNSALYENLINVVGGHHFRIQYLSMVLIWNSGTGWHILDKRYLNKNRNHLHDLAPINCLFDVETTMFSSCMRFLICWWNWNGLETVCTSGDWRESREYSCN